MSFFNVDWFKADEVSVKSMTELTEEELLDKLEKDVISKGHKYTLPSALPEEWVNFLIAGPEGKGDVDKYGIIMSALVVVIYGAQNRSHAETEDELHQMLYDGVRDYSRELMCEYDFRKGDVFYERADINSILTNRLITVARLKESWPYEAEYKMMDNIDVKQIH